MQFTFASVIAALALATSSLAVTVSYDNTYDNANGSLDTVACSDGEYGLIPPFTTFGSLPSFPNIGGASAVAGWNSPNCGSCWELSYNGVSINVLAIDHADDGFNISLEALNALTNGQGVQVGRIDATATEVDPSACGL